MTLSQQNFIAIGLRVSAPQIRGFAVHLGDYCRFFVRFLRFFNKLQPTPLTGFSRKNTSKDVVPGDGVPFAGHDDYI